jgi:hypothetical protein
VCARGEVARDVLEGAPAVRGLEDVGAAVVRLVTVERDVDEVCVHARGLDVRDRRVGREPRHVAYHVAPVLPAVGRHLKVAVVGAGPDDPGAQGGFGEADDGRVVLGARVLEGDGAARGLLLRLVVGRQVGADGRPGLAEVGGLEDDVAAEVDGVLVVRAGDERRVPVEAVLGELGRAAVVAHVGDDELLLARAHVGADDVGALRLGKIKVGVVGVVEHVEAVAETYHPPVVVLDADGLARAARARPGAVVL